MQDHLIVADASALIYSNALQEDKTFYTTPLVLNELRDQESKTRAETALKNGSLVLIEPGEEDLREARRIARVSTDLPDLSEADLSVLALCASFQRQGKDFVLYSDDYALLNASRVAGIEAKPVLEKGIRTVKAWVYSCKKCKSRFDRSADLIECPKCGGVLGKKSA